MDIILRDDGLASIPFEVTQHGYTLRDAIVGTPEYINSLTPAQIEQIKQERFDKWYAIITAVPEATPEQN